MNNLTSLLQWIAILPKVIDGGSAVLAQIRAVFSANGIDTAALDALILDADRRSALAASESVATK